MILLLLACTPKTIDSDPPGGDDTGEVCESDADCLSTEICETECVTGDRDNSADEATALVDDGSDNHYLYGEGHIEPAADVDWFSFSSDGNQFIRIDTVVDDESGETDYLDTVVTLYDAAGTLIAQEDNHPVGDVSTYDSVLFGYLAEPGTYTVTVTDVAGRDAPDVTYQINAKSLGDGGDEPDALQSAGLDVTFSGADLWYSIPVILGDTDDTADYVRLDLPWSDTFFGFITATSPSGSSLTEALTLYNSAGQTVMSAEDPTAESIAGVWASQDDTYVLKVADANGGSGANYWGFVYALTRDEGYGNPRESEPNDDLATADVLSINDQEPDIGSWITGYGTGHVDSLADADLWTLSVDFDDAFLTVYLGAQAYGGLLTPQIDILNSSGDVIASATSTPGADLDLMNAGPFAAGDYTVRFSGADTNTAEGEGAYYVFGFNASTSPLE